MTDDPTPAPTNGAVEGHIRVLLVDDQPLLLSGFSMILSTEDDIEVVGQARNGQEAVAAVAELSPDVVLMDVQMPVLDGIEATRRIREQCPECAVLVLTSFSDRDKIVGASAGDSGAWIVRDDGIEDI